MKLLKSIGLFLCLPCALFFGGMYAGSELEQYFYPRETQKRVYREESADVPGEASEVPVRVTGSERARSVSVSDEPVLNADTEYVVEEYDIKRDTLVETTWKIPAKYIGMDRDSFVQSMEIYALSPPLAEQQRGFVGVEVLSFSAQRVVVRMSYAYAEPTKSFYLRVEDNRIVVYCDDGETVYLYTDISAQGLPGYMQTQIIGGMYVEDEAALYQFLETYSS